MWAWILRLVGGWLPIGGKPIGEWLGKIIWVIGIVLVCLLVYRKFTQPTTNTNQRAEQIVNYNHNYPKMMFGCIRWGLEKEKK